MDQNTKQRLVGITVVFALAVIFLPMILDGAGVRKGDLEIDIPAQFALEQNPEFDQKIIELRAKIEELPVIKPGIIDEQNLVEADESPNTIERIAAVAKKATPVIDQAISKTEPLEQEIGGETWVLQVGSFGDHENALAQRDALRKSNIAAVFVEKLNTKDGASYRVRLGPFTNHQLSEIAQDKVKAKHNIDGLIMKYEK